MPGEIQQRLSADCLAGNGEPTPLVIGQPDPSVTELFEKDAILFPKEVDRREEDLPGLKGVATSRS